MAKKKFPKGIKTGIVIRGITDRHTGKKPKVIECKSAYELHDKLKQYLPKNAMPSYDWCLNIVKDNGYVQLIKKEFGKGFIYQI